MNSISVPHFPSSTFRSGCISFLLLTTSTIAVTAQESAKTNSAKIELEADILTYDSDTGEIIAEGQVTLQREGYTLLAGEIRYNEKTDQAWASGAVELRMPDGNKIVANRLELTDALRKAFVTDIRLLMSDGAQVSAKEAEHDDVGGRTTLKRAVYSPCKVCADSEDAPLWQLKAVRVVHDKGKRRLYYKDAYLEILGVPILWTPYLSHPDPTVDRASGLLPVELKTHRELGVVLGFPYHHVFSKSQDLTIKPILTSNEGLILAGDYRHHIGVGAYTIDGSITYTDERDATNLKTGSQEFRGNLSAQGQFQHTPNWRSTFNLNWASDDTYLRRYDFSDEDTLINDYRLEGFYGRSYVSTRALAFQGLRVEDVTGLSAFALPLLDAEYVSNYKPLGGTLAFQGNALALHRLDGLDTQRVTVSASWQRHMILNNGLVVDLDSLVRSDTYNIDNVATPDDPAYIGTGDSDVRGMARATAMVSYPLINTVNSGTHIVEPIMEITLAPASRSSALIVNEDSRAFELNALNLFSSNRAAGYDLWENGSRVTYGLRWQYEGAKLSTSVLFGQSFRISGSNSDIFAGSGFEGNASDIVGITRISYSDWLDLEHRIRLDDQSLDTRRNEADLHIGSQKASLTLGYLKLDRNYTQFLLDDRSDREEIRAAANYQFDNNWRLYGSVIQDLTQGSDGVEYNIGIGYTDECIDISLQLRESFTSDRDIEPGKAVLFHLKLKNLG